MEADEELQYGLEEEEEEDVDSEGEFDAGDDDDGEEEVPLDDETFPDKIYFGGERQVNDMAFHPSQDLLAAGIIDGCVEMYSISPRNSEIFFSRSFPI